MRASIPTCLTILLSLYWPGAGYGQAVYKSVDDQGNVTYSRTPPADAAKTESVTIHDDAPSAPSAQSESLRTDMEKRAAEDQKRREDRNAQKTQRAVAVDKAEKRLRDAQAELGAAQRDLQTARASVDRQGGLDQGAAIDRVEKAKRKVQAAKDGLNAAKTAPLPQPQPAATVPAGAPGS